MRESKTKWEKWKLLLLRNGEEEETDKCFGWNRVRKRRRWILFYIFLCCCCFHWFLTLDLALNGWEIIYFFWVNEMWNFNCKINYWTCEEELMCKILKILWGMMWGKVFHANWFFQFNINKKKTLTEKFRK